MVKERKRNISQICQSNSTKEAIVNVCSDTSYEEKSPTRGTVKHYTGSLATGLDKLAKLRLTNDVMVEGLEARMMLLRLRMGPCCRGMLRQR